MARKKVMETTYLYPEQLEALRERRARTHIPVSEQIREAVTEYLQRHGAPAKELDQVLAAAGDAA